MSDDPLEYFMTEIKSHLQLHKPNDPDSFLLGYLVACRWYGIWKDGEQLLGGGPHTVKEVRMAIERLMEERT